MTKALFVVLLAATSVVAWDDVTGDRDMPWLGSGGRARWFHDRSQCFMCPTGYRDQERWGRSRWTGEDPYTTVGQAMRFLHDAKELERWPEAIGAGSVGGEGPGTIEPRALPYRLTVVMIEPTVIVMRFDLGALVGLPAPHDAPTIGTPWLNQGVEFGVRVPASGTLLWFSPDAKQRPTPVGMRGDDHGEIVAQGKRLVLDRRGGTWQVTVPSR